MTRQLILRYPLILPGIVFFFLPLLIIWMQLVDDVFLTEEIWKLHYITALVCAYYFGIKGGLTVGVLGGLMFFLVETEQLRQNGFGNLYFSHLFTEMIFSIFVDVSLGFFADRLKSAQQKLALTKEKLASMAVVAERNNLAREIHDGLAQDLHYIGFKIGTIEEHLDSGRHGRIHEELGELHTIVDASINQIRSSISDLRFKIATGRSLSETLALIVQRFENYFSFRVYFYDNTTEETKLSKEVEMQIVRIVQEALTNAAKHSDSESVELNLLREGNMMIIKVSDKGKGFYPEIFEQKVESGNFGLRTMKERAMSISGRFSLQSKPGEGTDVILSFPINITKEG